MVNEKPPSPPPAATGFWRNRHLHDALTVEVGRLPATWMGRAAGCFV